jgi:serine/threonine-protein kinase
MSPEQAMGEAVDRRSDLYSIGAVLYECFTGRRMWGTGTDFDVLRRLALENPPDLASSEGGTAEAPPALAQLYAQLIDRDRERRPKTAADVERALRAYSEATSGADVRATMDRLFEGEHARRAKAIEDALSAVASGDTPSALPATRSVGAGESGPVFVTHQAPPPSSGRRRRTTAIVIPATLAGMVCGLAGMAFALRGPVPRDAPPPATATPHAATLGASEPAPSAAQAPTSTAEVTRPAPPAPAPPLVLTASPRVTPNVARRVAVPRVGPATLATPAGLSSSRAAPPPASTPKTPEPPDVDPTPF